MYATYQTTGREFWGKLASECQQEFRRSGAVGECIEARELIIALPEEYTQYAPQVVLQKFTDEFKRRYGVECVSALHHNKRKTNYHIHLIFSERKSLDEPDCKIATRSVFFDEKMRRVRTKKEICDENGKLRSGCKIIPKGEVYERHYFTAKDERFKADYFLREVKAGYTDLINRHIQNPERFLKIYDPNSVYLPTKKIGKNNPKAAEIRADNVARQEWNRTADMALIAGIEEAKILEIKKTEIRLKAKDSIQKYGWLPGLFRKIVSRAKNILQVLIRKTEIPPQPVLSLDLDEFRKMQELMIKAQEKSREIKVLKEVELPKLKVRLTEMKGIFKLKERKALEEQVRQVEKQISRLLEELPHVLEDDGYPDVQAFVQAYRKAELVVEQYNRELVEWERKVKEAERLDIVEKPSWLRPGPESVKEKLREIQAEGRKRTKWNIEDRER